MRSNRVELAERKAQSTWRAQQVVDLRIGHVIGQQSPFEHGHRRAAQTPACPGSDRYRRSRRTSSGFLVGKGAGVVSQYSSEHQLGHRTVTDGALVEIVSDAIFTCSAHYVGVGTVRAGISPHAACASAATRSTTSQSGSPPLTCRRSFVDASIIALDAYIDTGLPFKRFEIGGALTGLVGTTPGQHGKAALSPCHRENPVEPRLRYSECTDRTTIAAASPPDRPRRGRGEGPDCRGAFRSPSWMRSWRSVRSRQSALSPELRVLHSLPAASCEPDPGRLR